MYQQSHDIQSVHGKAIWRTKTMKNRYRTDGMNEFFRQIELLRGSARGEGIKETDTDCSMSVLVERQINLSNLFIKGLTDVIEYWQKKKRNA